jgi:hypothetical protein
LKRLGGGYMVGLRGCQFHRQGTREVARVFQLPVVIVMGFGATHGGNATLVGASANTVSVGICIREAGQVTSSASPAAACRSPSCSAV